MRTLADRLRSLLEKTGTTQAALARACNVSQPTVAGWLGGDIKTLKASSLLALANHFDVYEEWINSGKGPKWRTAQSALRAGEMALFMAARDVDTEGAPYSSSAASSWPMQSISPEEFAALPEALKRRVESYARGLLDATRDQGSPKDLN